MTISKLRFIIIIAAAFVVGAILSCAFAMFALSPGGSSSESIDQKKLHQIDQLIDKYYLNKYDQKELIDNAYRGYVAGLGDEYSAYMTKEESENYETSLSGTYSGVGITFSEDEKGNFVVVSVTKNSPAANAGIKEGDFLLKVDGESFDSTDTMATHIRGKKGTKVELTYSRDGKEDTVTMIRDEISQDSVEYEMLDGGIGYIKISSFIDNTQAEFDKALKAIEAQNPKGLILDLRNNGGGLVDDAVGIADDFLDAGVACYISDKNGNTESYDVKDGKTDLKTVVLVNENSASSSEILAAALKDNGFPIVGTKTFGKGIVQTTLPLSDGDTLKLTVYEYLSPDKHKVHKKGVTPNVKVKDDEKTKTDEQLEKAKDLI